MCGRIIQTSGPLRYAFVDGMNVRDSRVHNYPPRWNAAALEDGEYLWKQTIRSAGRAAADTDMPSGQGTDAISNNGPRLSVANIVPWRRAARITATFRGLRFLRMAA
jgi:hypothetical protein